MREKCFEVPPSAGRGRHSECLIIGPRVQLDSSRREGFPKSNFLAQGEREKRSRDSGGQKGGKIKAHLKRRGGKKRNRLDTSLDTDANSQEKGLRFRLDCSEPSGVEMTHESQTTNGSEGRRTAEELN